MKYTFRPGFDCSSIVSRHGAATAGIQKMLIFRQSSWWEQETNMEIAEADLDYRTNVAME